MANEIPQWADKRVEQIIDAERGNGYAYRNLNDKLWATFARYVMKHEEPPVDPLVTAMNRAIGRVPPFHDCEADNFRTELAKHGLQIIELAKDGS